jgi:CheY-like chemotaxis protein
VPSAAANGELSLQGLKILVVEDDEDSREMLETILRHHGAGVWTAENVENGFASFVSNKPDILISDVGLPEQDGYDLIRRIRRLSPEQGGQVPAIALTGYVSVHDQHEALNAGYDEHLSKPIDTDHLIGIIINLITKPNRFRRTFATG